MRYALDTNAVVDLQTGHPQVSAKLLSVSLADLSVTVLTVEEMLSGWYTLLRKAKTPERLAIAYQRLGDSVALVGKFPILPFTLPAIRRFEQLKALKLGVKHMDLRIAAVAIESGAVLVTSNTVDFAGIPGLTIEDWRTA